MTTMQTAFLKVALTGNFKIRKTDVTKTKAKSWPRNKAIKAVRVEVGTTKIVETIQ